MVTPEGPLIKCSKQVTPVRFCISLDGRVPGPKMGLERFGSFLFFFRFSDFPPGFQPHFADRTTVFWCEESNWDPGATVAGPMCLPTL